MSQTCGVSKRTPNKRNNDLDVTREEIKGKIKGKITKKIDGLCK